jgi:hypothetical protein
MVVLSIIVCCAVVARLAHVISGNFLTSVELVKKIKSNTTDEHVKTPVAKNFLGMAGKETIFCSKLEFRRSQPK